MKPPAARGTRRRGPAREAGPLAISEEDFQRRVIDTAKLNGWKVVHFRKVKMPSGKWATPLQGDAGFPDLALAHGGRVLLVELKTDTGQVEDHQAEWLNEIGQEHGRVWRPRDWDVIVAELSRRATRNVNMPPCCNPHPRG